MCQPVAVVLSTAGPHETPVPRIARAHGSQSERSGVPPVGRNVDCTLRLHTVSFSQPVRHPKWKINASQSTYRSASRSSLESVAKRRCSCVDIELRRYLSPSRFSCPGVSGGNAHDSAHSPLKGAPIAILVNLLPLHETNAAGT